MAIAISSKIDVACPYCKTYGQTTHSFHEIARTPRFGRIIYTCVAKATDYSNTSAIASHIKFALDKDGHMPWTWVFDCNDLKMKHTVHLDVAMTLGKLLRDKYAESLFMILIINPTSGIDTIITRILPILSSDAMKYTRKCKGSPLEIYCALQKEGIEEEGLMAIMGEIRSN